MSKKVLILKILLATLFLIILGNVIFLDVWFLKEKEIPSPSVTVVPTALPTPTLFSPAVKTATPSSQADDICPQSCLLAIDKAAGTLSSLPQVAPQSASAKIFYLPLGGGSTKNQEWADIPGLSSYIDPASYGKVKTVIFEASLRIPTANGRMYVRLYNKNDGRPVWFSEISSEGATSTLIQSLPITFEAGNKLYQVQAKTSMGFESFVDFARIKFITE